MQQQQTSLKDIDFRYYVLHYFRLLWRWKLFIAFIGPIAGGLALLGVLKSGMLKYPPLPASVFIGLDSKSPANTFGDFSGVNQNRERLLLSRSFLEQVVSKLSLQFSLSNHLRYEVFDSVQVDSTAPIGLFRFELDKVNPDYYKITYTNKALGVKNKAVESGNITLLNKLTLPGIKLQFAQAFLKEPHNFEFSIIPVRFAVDRILNKMKVTSPNLREQMFYFSATLEGSDYPLVTQILNTVADLFIDNNLNMQKGRMRATLNSLKTQLAAAEEQLSKSKSELRNFFATNPSVGLSQGVQQIMTELIGLETGTFETNNIIEFSKELKKKFISSPEEEKVQILSEIIIFLQSKGSLSAPALQNSFSQYLAEKENALVNYAKSHPVFKEIDGKLAVLSSRAVQAIDTYIDQCKKTMVDRSLSIQKITSKLQGLPSKELQLAELQKRQEIDAEIYTTLLSKFNEAKVSETVEGSDIFIMEYAVQPIPPSRMLQLLKGAAIIFAAALAFGFGPPVLMDLIDKTARSEQALIRLLPYRFLETIPVVRKSHSYINVPEKKPEASSKKSAKARMKRGLKGEILINEPGIIPPYTIELFRSLVTKIQLDLYEEPVKSIVISSLDMDEGKSTIAANLALSIAEHGINTVLVDCDMRRGVAHRILSLDKTPGLVDYLTDANKTDNRGSSELPIQKTAIPNLWMISSGAMVNNPQRLLRSQAMESLQSQLSGKGFFIVYDSPPVGLAADAAILSRIATRYIIVVRAGYTNVVKLRKLIEKDYPIIGKKALGMVLNMGETTEHLKYYSYY